MKIGILGSGNIGGSLGRLWAAAGHEVFFASRHPEELQELAEEAGHGARVGTSDEAMAFGDVVLDALPFAASLDLPADALAGKILVMASNYYPERDGDIDLGGVSQSECLAAKLTDTHVVKAFNMMSASEMEARANGMDHDEIAILFAGNDDDAKSAARQLIEDAKFVPVDAGKLRQGELFQSGDVLYAKRLTHDEAVASLTDLENATG